MEEGAAQQPAVPEPGPQAMRFEATVHPGRAARSLERVADLDLDRVPDPEGGVRLLLTADDAAKLVSRGYEVHLVEVLPAKPLDAELVATEGAVLGWLEEQVRGVQRQQGH